MTGTDTLHINGNRTLNGPVNVPGDKSISHRALMLAAIANGTSTLTGLSTGSDVRATRNALQAMGATIVNNPDATLTITGTEQVERANDIGNCRYRTATTVINLRRGAPRSGTKQGHTCTASHSSNDLERPKRKRIDGMPTVTPDKVLNFTSRPKRSENQNKYVTGTHTGKRFNNGNSQLNKKI